MATPDPELVAQVLLDQAERLASEEKYAEALAKLRQIPRQASLYALVESKIEEFTQGQAALNRAQREQRLVEEAERLVKQRRFREAIDRLKTIPRSSSRYNEVQGRIKELGRQAGSASPAPSRRRGR